MAAADTLPFGLTRYRITRKADGRRLAVVARNTGTAWRIFLEQYFGALKPSRDEYRIRAEMTSIPEPLPMVHLTFSGYQRGKTLATAGATRSKPPRRSS